MEKKTHIMCANAVSLCIIQPQSIFDLLLVAGFSTLGALLPDVDLKDSIPDKIFDRLMASLITIVLMSFIIKFLFNIDLYCKIKECGDIFSYIICISIFIVMGYLGSKTSHRSFTHSILGCIIYSAILSYCFNSICLWSFIFAYISHVFLDLFNKKGIAIFYPAKYRFAFKLCDSSGKVNKFLFITFSILCVSILILLGLS